MDIGRTEHDYMNPSLVELLGNDLATRAGAIVRIVYDDLSTFVEEFPDLLLTAL